MTGRVSSHSAQMQRAVLRMVAVAGVGALAKMASARRATAQARHIFPLSEAEHPNVSKRPHLPPIDAHATRMGTVFYHTNAMLTGQRHHVANRTSVPEQMG